MMKIGIFALGSYHERHGPALPPDTDAKIAEYIAKKVAKKTKANFLGTLKSSYELAEIKTGKHDEIEDLTEELKSETENAKTNEFTNIVLINAHGGNQELEKFIPEIEEDLGVRLKMNSTICNIEGPHAGTGEISIGKIIGITDENKIEEQNRLEKYPEIGFHGIKEARKKYRWAEKHAQEVEQEEIKIDNATGKKLLKEAIESGIKSVEEIKKEQKSRSSL